MPKETDCLLVPLAQSPHVSFTLPYPDQVVGVRYWRIAMNGPDGGEFVMPIFKSLTKPTVEALTEGWTYEVSEVQLFSAEGGRT